MDEKFPQLDSKLVFDGKIFKVRVDRVRFPHGRDVSLEVVRHPPSVVLIPIPEPGRVFLVRQFRYPVNQWMWELPAGSIDPGESAETAARRECHEEIGMLPVRLELVGRFFPTPGYCDEEMNIYRIDGLEHPRDKATQDEDEILEPRTFTIDEARAMVRRGEITDMKTALALTLV